ncbi:dihydrofolate reductase [Peribacillus deserti]|uniref:Dihydrofolate reductase n=1 Tax=Peribacillus deserti TaxID=673318 RepID=A0ABS2QE51_9BACI|nr:dihydrofolate reductase [Peribacillus deserti]MBM7691408.1 dihydrofolate reductase [Peribacillus deserti]
MISFLVAMDQNRVIGRNNDLPWHLPADLKFFKQVTMGHPIIMGRKTHESIGRPLSGRENIILTRNRHYKAEGCTIIHTIEEITNLEESSKDEFFIIGGAEIFNLTFSIADRMYITLIEDEFEGDTHFPKINEEEWQLVSREKGPKDEKNPYDYYFCVYDRK